MRKEVEVNNREEEEEEEEERYKGPTGFKKVVVKEDYCSLLDIDISPNSELWLFQFPRDHALDLKDGQQISLNLHGDDLLGSFRGSSGKSYDMVSFPSQNSNASVFLPSADGQPTIVGKISRHVSLVHFPEPRELQKQNDEKQKMKSGKSVTTSSRYNMTTSTHSAKTKSAKPTSSHSTRHKSSLSEGKETPNPKKRKHSEDGTKLTGQSTLDSGSLQHSSERRSKRNKKA